MSEKKYLDSNTAYNAGTLSDWYISSVDDSDPIWTDAHIDELVNDFYVIPKDTPAADVAPVVQGHWCEDEFDVWCSNCSCAYPKDGTGIAGWRKISKYCDNCGAKMDESEDNDNA